MKDVQKPYRIRTISEFHQLRGLSKPEHPLISVVDYESIRHSSEFNVTSWTLDFYSISLKRNSAAKMKYGQQEYDFDDGILFFMAPGQVFRIEINVERKPDHSGWILLIHPDFIWNTSLAKNIKKYEYFDYSVSEALFLSEKEETLLNNIIGNIQQEYHSNIDPFSQDIIISQIETLLNYAERFYHRQFITRKITNHKILDRLEEILAEYFREGDLRQKGLPSVQHVADLLDISPNYLSGLLKVLTGQSTQQHIHDKLIEKAKERLSTTDLPITAIAYELGFEHSQSFSKLFKSKTNLSPQEFRRSFH
ncbi:AraC family transcriptional regulator [Leptospira wolffii]|uniref:helix-turn-helix domain-containing protein n=1 Tax=Leptospira wolffii TaxID=409998 RepID=UPI0010824379|nr:response regulator transcription factor [Leptospira wolffii]TGK55964.1 AraC family transcriptional regulator [Leptospira wolffii]TGK68384.1 AraC family transcriptional regulator [Leptospira wolffii]TGK72010.1 AraC family transcriptional regulator [Leptospira wolffii]TGL27587.1 AraC family transcriptional regulator [Leptospira wolffii]